MFSLNGLQELIEKEISKLDFKKTPSLLYDPIAYVISLGGKRLRPALLLMACDLFEGEIEKAVKPALAIELFHNFTLLHDDIMDNAPIRRSQQTVHAKWNTNVAILSGDAMFVKAFELMSSVDKSIIHNVINLFCKTSLEVCEGQQLDMDFETAKQVSIDDYLQMIELKTAVLLAASLKIGAIIAGATEKDAEHLYQFGKNLGIAFQLHDDVLDVYADRDKFGKQTGGDIISNKKTFLLLKAFEIADAKTKKELETVLQKNSGNPSEKVSAVISIYDMLNIKNHCENKMQHYFETALRHFESVSCSTERKKPLMEFAKKLMVREK